MIDSILEGCAISANRAASIFRTPTASWTSKRWASEPACRCGRTMISNASRFFASVEGAASVHTVGYRVLIGLIAEAEAAV